MKFTKHHGLGNDFLVALVDAVPDGAADLARTLCNRHTGLGADGLIFGVRGESPEFVLRNADGSAAEVSGNGLRCLGQALAREANVDDLDLVVKTVTGDRLLSIRQGTHSTSHVRVDMGGVSDGPSLDGRNPLEVLPGVRAASIDIGNPHVIIEVASLDGIDMASVGPAIEANFLPVGINVHAIAASSSDSIDMLIWERGVGTTEACGSGACAAAVAAHGWGLVDPDVSVAMPGGAAQVVVGDTVLLIGPSTFVATVDVPIEWDDAHG